jgi:hypothetical protein
MRSKAGRVLDWIEAWCPVPEGKLMGEWMVVEKWQRESLYQIYNNAGKDENGEASFLPEIELKLDRVDTHALALAFVQAEDHGGERRVRQFAALRAQGRSWQQVARLASYVEQCRNLELLPHEVAPCWVIDPDDTRIDQEAAKLVREMLKAGVSQYHPNPMQAIKAANGRAPSP